MSRKIDRLNGAFARALRTIQAPNEMEQECLLRHPKVKNLKLIGVVRILEQQADGTFSFFPIAGTAFNP